MFILGSSDKADLSMKLTVFLQALCVLWVHLVHGEACRKNFFMCESGRRLILGKRLAETEQIEELIIGKAIFDGKGLAPGVHGISFAGKPVRAVLDMFSLMHFVTRSFIDINMLLLIQQASHGQQRSATDAEPF